MHPTVLNGPLLRIATRREPLRRLWWKRWETRWKVADGPVGQLYLQLKVT